ncbi:uncharacterized protein LOC133193413 [Saccostrea echinata]|uniref:uncharacterized protein LOC133193413 n=1 Tax=Saccostrea echinata TaxID=191078 RepID=UPI002A833401|nr:uncharacterized protein LOC133193413 [Saccostrea echinata]
MDSIGEEREQIEEDIERLNLALQVEGSEVELQDEDDEDVLCINEDSIEHEDYESVDTIFSISSEAKQGVPSEIDQFSGMSEISHLPINAETCLALNRTYQELILESLKKIELALNENREKQRVLEEGLEMKSAGGSKSTEKQGSKKKCSTMFCKPYFKDKDQKVPPPNTDVQMKKLTQEHKQDVTPPLPWSVAQRCKLQEAVKEEALKQKLVPIMNRKEVYVERVKNLESELVKINIDKSELEDGDEANLIELNELNERGQKKEQELAEWQEKIEQLDRDMEKVKETSEIELLFSVDSEKVDWLMIANFIFGGKREEKECEIMWNNVLHPSINKEKWSTQETKHLQELANKYNMKNWPAIAHELGTGRTPFQCLQFYQHSLNDAYHNRPWSEEEDEMLKEVVDSVRVGNKISFAQVSYFLDGRSQNQCQSRWNQINPTTKRGRWTLQEDCLLMTAVQLHGAKNWRLLQEYVPGRTALQCRDRYNHCLNPAISSPEPWTYEEDKKLLKHVYAMMETGNPVKWIKLASEFPGRTDNQLLGRYKRLQTWEMKTSWLAEQSKQQRRDLGVMEGEQLQTEIMKSEPSVCFQETAQLFPDVVKEDYLKQIVDRRRGDLVVPRPPVMTKNNTRCFKAVWERKKQLHTLVNQHLQNLNSVVPPNGTAIKEFNSFGALSKDQQKAVQNMMSNQPNQITVRDMLNLTRKITRAENCREARAKRWEQDILYDEQIKDVLIWKCFHSLLVEKRIGRPRKFYLFSPTGRKPPVAEDDEEENVEKITDITLTLLMNALDLDYEKALMKSKQMDMNDPTVKEDIAFLKRVTPSILPTNTAEKRITNTNIQNVSTISTLTKTGPPRTTSLSTARSSSSESRNIPSTSAEQNSQSHKTPSTSTGQDSQSQKTPSTSTGQNSQSQETPTSVGQNLAYAQNKRPDLDQNVQSCVTSQYNVIRQQDKTLSGNGRKRKAEGSNNEEEQIKQKKSKETSSLSNINKDTAENASDGSNSAKDPTKSQTVNNSVTGGAPGTTSNIKQATISTEQRPTLATKPSAIPAGARVIKLPPGVKLKPGDKIQDILAAHKASMSSPTGHSVQGSQNQPTGRSVQGSQNQPTGHSVQGSQQNQPTGHSVQGSQNQLTGHSVQGSQNLPQTQTTAAREATSSTTVAGGSQTQKQSVVVIRPPSGIQDPNRVKILPPGTVTTSAFKSLLLHRKYLMKKADEVYSRQFYKIRGEELQKRITVELAKQSGVKVEEDISESEYRAGTLSETLHATDNSIVSDVAANLLKKCNKTNVHKDALARVRRSKEYKMLQKRFEALFAWPALLSTVCPENVENPAQNKPTSVQNTKKKNVYPKVITKKGTPYTVVDKSELSKEPVRRKKVTKKSYPCVKSKYTWRRVVMDREIKKIKREARLKKLQETLEKKQRGEFQPQKKTKRIVTTTSTRKSQRMAVKRSLPQLSESHEVSAPKQLKRLVRKKKQGNSEKKSQDVKNNSFQLLGDAVVPVALISNISSSIANGSVPSNNGDNTVSISHPFPIVQSINSISGQISSTGGGSTLAVNDGSTIATSLPLQEGTLPLVAITDMHIQTVPSTNGDGEPPVVFAFLPSAMGDGQVEQIQVSESIEMQGTAPSINVTQVVPESEQK